MKKLFFYVLAVLSTAVVPALAQSPAPLNKFAEACAMWTPGISEQPGSYHVREWLQRHRTIYMMFEEMPEMLVQCHFHDLKDDVPELVDLIIDGKPIDRPTLRNLNERIWLKYFPDPATP